MKDKTWLWLAEALVWANTRHEKLTAEVSASPTRNCSIEWVLHVATDTAELRDKEFTPQFASTSDVWPAVRALVADEKIAAEGKSVFRRGVIHVRVTRFENAPIPSGDANELVILTGISGFEPDDVLGHKDAVLHNWQGRYWHDVRLRAEDVFREFPPLLGRVVACDFRESVAAPGQPADNRRSSFSKGCGSRCRPS